MNRRTLLAWGAFFLCPAPALAGESEIFTGIVTGVALGGYDAVSYFAGGSPRVGTKAFSTDWKGAHWRFASAENLAAFKTAPESYAPQYGGYCAYAVSRGATASGDPMAWTLANGKLYLNFSKAVRTEWRQDIPGNVASADANWPGVLE